MPVIPASHRDLLDGQFATLATIGPDGRPQLSEVWFLAEDDTIGTSLNTAGRRRGTCWRIPPRTCSSWTWQTPTATWKSAAMPRSHQMMTTPSPPGSARRYHANLRDHRRARPVARQGHHPPGASQRGRHGNLTGAAADRSRQIRPGWYAGGDATGERTLGLHRRCLRGKNFPIRKRCWKDTWAYDASPRKRESASRAPSAA